MRLIRYFLPLVAACAAAATLSAQPGKMEFDVASVKASTAVGGTTFGVGNGGASEHNVTLKTLIAFAYKLQEFQVSGGPGVGALRELRDLLSSLQASAGCGKASLKIMPKEGIDETAEAKHTATASTAPAAGPASSGFTGAPTKRPRKRTGGTSLESRR